jgi:hypothetical protein
MAQMFCIRYDFASYAMAKALDPLGVLTKSGEIKLMGAFIFHDFVFKSLQNTALAEEDIKGIIDPNEPCAFPARYHSAVMPKHRARMFSVNIGKSTLDDTVDDPGYWFQTEGITALAYLARRDADGIRRLGDRAAAMARRVIIFQPTAGEIGLNTSRLAADLDLAVARGIAAEAQFYKENIHMA